MIFWIILTVFISFLILVYKWSSLESSVLKNDDDYQWSLNQLKNCGKTFYFVLNFLPSNTRQYIVYYYSFCRISDDMVDESEDPKKKIQILNMYFDLIYSDYPDNYVESKNKLSKFSDDNNLSDIEDKALKIYQKLIYFKKIERYYSELLIKGYEMDVLGEKIENQNDLIRYCVYVAGSVGMMLCLLFDIRDKNILKYANSYGIGLQLTNIARDIITDSKMNRIYVPSDMLDTNHEAFLNICKNFNDQNNNREIRNHSINLINIAENYYRYGMIGIKYLPFQIRFAFLLIGYVYRQIGVKIKREPVYPIRTVVSTYEKMSIIATGVIFYITLNYPYLSFLDKNRNYPPENVMIPDF